jgi:hypothetical protein
VEMRPGTLWMFCDGAVIAQCDTSPAPPAAPVEADHAGG